MNDSIEVDLLNQSVTSLGTFALNGATLALSGSTVQPGAYTLLSVTSGAYSGTFGDITYNGVSADPMRFSLAYTPSAVTLTVADIPEPTTTLAAAAIGGLMLRRRR